MGNVTIMVKVNEANAPEPLSAQIRIGGSASCLVGCDTPITQADVDRGGIMAMTGRRAVYVYHLHHFFDARGEPQPEYFQNLEIVARAFQVAEGLLHVKEGVRG